MFKTLTILSLLLLIAYSDTFLTVDCYQCNGTLCILLNGGPFQNATYTNPLAPTCLQAGDFPYEENFTCSGRTKCKTCSLILSSFNQFSTGYCYESQAGYQITHFLDICYSRQIGDESLSSKYDWCNCGDSRMSAGQIAGLAVGVVSAVIMLIFCYCYCCMEKKFQFMIPKDSSASTATS